MLFLYGSRYYCVLCFFVCYGDHRDLHVLTHSFPTRRSSDLLDQQPLPKPSTPAAQPSSHENVRGADYYTQEELFDDDPTHPEPVAPTAAGRQDRKSTRLNSSH